MCIKITLDETLTLQFWQNLKTDTVTKQEKLGSKKTLKITLWLNVKFKM